MPLGTQRPPPLGIVGWGVEKNSLIDEFLLINYYLLAILKIVHPSLSRFRGLVFGTFESQRR